MTTEQCSYDSLLPKNRTETFARQLTHRLRSLSDETDRDGLEDTSWNGDQLSSSSDNDIYYDLDSSPASPAEEVTETEFSKYIGIKNSENIFQTSSELNLMNANEHSLSENDKNVDCRYLGNLIKSDNLTNGNNYEDINPRFSYNKSDSECGPCDQCRPTADISLPQTNVNNDDKCSSSSFFNGFGIVGHSSNRHSNCITNIDNIIGEKDFKHFTEPEAIVKNSQRFKLNEPNIKNSLINNLNEYPIISNGHSSNKNIQNVKNDSFVIDSCVCNKLVGDLAIDINCNDRTFHTELNNNHSESIEVRHPSKMTVESHTSQSCTEEQSNIDKRLTDCDINKKFETNCEEKNEETRENNVTNECDKLQYTEDDLCRLVDAVFSKSKDEGYSCSKESDNGINCKKGDEENEEIESIESKRSKFRRSSSLKTGKTPPGTPGHKKIVRFADVLGLDLADVRTFLDEVPKIPKSAYLDLKDVELLSSSPPVQSNWPADYLGHSSTTSKLQKTILPLFQQPSGRPDFLDRVKDNCVCLENAVISDPKLCVIMGVVRVKNIDFHKSVHIRYSIDKWKSFADLQAKYIPNSCDGFSDKFSFMLYGHMLNPGQRLEFAVRYHANGNLYWDSNYGANYSFQCVSDDPSKFPSPSYLSPSNITEPTATFY